MNDGYSPWSELSGAPGCSIVQDRRLRLHRILWSLFYREGTSTATPQHLQNDCKIICIHSHEHKILAAPQTLHIISRSYHSHNNCLAANRDHFTDILIAEHILPGLLGEEERKTVGRTAQVVHLHQMPLLFLQVLTF